jgi:hypothetical protein
MLPMCKLTSKPFLLLLLLLLSCAEEEPLDGYPYPDVHPDFRVYVDRFITEAEKRGYELDYSGLTARYETPIIIDEKIYCGFGYNRNGKFNKPVILIDQVCWQAETNDLARESFFFHELGHSILYRFHRDDIFFNGDKQSLMCGDCNQFDIYSSPEDAFKREYYIDELFLGYNNYYPDWAK